MSLEVTLDQFLPQIEDDLQQAVRVPHDSLAPYYGIMRYHLGWVDEELQAIQASSGKRLRPLICLLACEAAGGDATQALPAASALELVHNFSLVHDDIQDVSHFRRGRRAVWDIWGTAHGINVGDGLFVLARLSLHRLSDWDVPLCRQQAATLALDKACLALCEGQYFDMTFEESLEVDLDQYQWMIRHKTAALLAASAQMGTIVGTEDAKCIDGCYCFGEQLGMAFQIQDDILGTWGDPQVTGKSAATDIRDKKKTLPVVYALNHPDHTAAKKLSHLYSHEGRLNADQIESVLSILDEVGAHQYSEKMAENYYSQALESLDQTGIRHASQLHMRKLAASLLGRAM